MANIQDVGTLVNEFKKLLNQPNPPVSQANDILAKLKLAMTKFAFTDQNRSPEETKQQLLISREILENAALWSVKQKDIPSFERYIAQLKTYYYDYAEKIPASTQQYPILGLNLLRLLAKNKLDEFHIELELIPLDKHTNIYIKHPVQLEQYMMEGAYNKVLKGQADVPSDYYALFMGMLMDTVRDEIADCSEASFNTLSVAEAQRLLALQDANKVREYAEKRNWKLENNVIRFKHEVVEKTEIPTMKLIQQTLHYARELERIV